MLSFDVLVFIHIIVSLFLDTSHPSFMVRFRSSLWQRLLALRRTQFVLLLHLEAALVSHGTALQPVEREQVVVLCVVASSAGWLGTLRWKLGKAEP